MGDTQNQCKQPGRYELPADLAALRPGHSVLVTPEVIFAVVWCDFVPMSLPCKDHGDAIEQAKAINHRRALIEPDLPRWARARPVLLEADDTIVWLDGEGTCDEGDADGKGVSSPGPHVSDPDR